MYFVFILASWGFSLIRTFVFYMAHIDTCDISRPSLYNNDTLMIHFYKITCKIFSFTINARCYVIIVIIFMIVIAFNYSV